GGPVGSRTRRGRAARPRGRAPRGGCCASVEHAPGPCTGRMTPYDRAMRVLVVEDEAKMASLLRRGLEREAYAVDVAENGVDAIWLATENSYDAIVLDVMIPAPDGFEVCRTLRDRGQWAPVLLLTARDAVADRVAGL